MGDTDPDLDTIIRELVEWMDGWEWVEPDGHRNTSVSPKIFIHKEYSDRPNHMWWGNLKSSLDLVRKIEDELPDSLIEHYMTQLQSIIGAVRCELTLHDAVTADPEPRLRALYRTLREDGEIE